jgi:ribonuclease HI
MPYRMDIWVDGACRDNGRPGARGAAAAVWKPRFGRHHAWTKLVPSYPTPTNQRAELLGIIFALEQALKRYKQLHAFPHLILRIHTDSKYAIGCMTAWVSKWSQNDWTNAAGRPVANQDLVKTALDLEDRILLVGSLQYIWVPRDDNTEADGLCNMALDLEEDEQNDYFDWRDDDY